MSTQMSRSEATVVDRALVPSEHQGCVGSLDHEGGFESWWGQREFERTFKSSMPALAVPFGTR